MDTSNWISLVGSVILQIIGLIIVLWQFSLKSNKRSAERDAAWQTRLDNHDEKFRLADKTMEEIKTHIAEIERQFNHRFTDYKNEVIALIRELKEDREKSSSILNNQLTCLSKKLTSLSLDMAFLKGERNKEGKSKFPSQQHHETENNGE